MRAHEDMVFAMDGDRQRRRFATASRDGSLALWDLDSGAAIARTPAMPTAPAMSVALSPDGQTVFAGFGDGSLMEWTPGTAGGLRLVGTYGDDVRSIDLSPSGLLAAASNGGEAKIWNPVEAVVIHTLEDQPGGVHGVRFSADGASLLTWNSGGSVWLRDATTLAPILQVELGGKAETAAICADGSVIAAGGAEGRIRVWDAATGDLRLDTGASPSATSVISLILTPDGQTLFTGKIDRTICRWTIGLDVQSQLLARHDEAVSALFLDEQTNRLVSASWDRTVRLWPLDEGLHSGPMTTLQAHDNHILSVAFSPDGDLLATAGRDDVIHLWEPALGLKLATLTGHTSDIYATRFAPDGEHLASGSADGSVRLWSTLTGDCQAVLGPLGGPLFGIAFSPDGASLAAAGDDGVITMWDLATHSARLSIDAHDSRVIGVAFDPGGSTLASCARDGSVRIWDAQTGAALRTLIGHKSDVFACIFSPDGSRLFTGSRDQTVRVWDPRTGESLATLDCRGQFITSLSFDAAGKRLAAGSWFAEVTVWDLQTLDAVFSFKGNTAAIRSLGFCPTAPVLVCAGHDGVATIWSGEPGVERRIAREEARANLAAAEFVLNRRLPDPNTAAEELVALAEDPGIDSEFRAWLRKAILCRESSRRSTP